MTLFIDTTELGKAVFALHNGHDKASPGTFFAGVKNTKLVNFHPHAAGIWEGAWKRKDFPVTPQESFKILEYLENFLKQNKVKKTEIKKIVIYKGKGSFTGLRVGVAIVQGLSLSLAIPLKVVAKK